MAESLYKTVCAHCLHEIELLTVCKCASSPSPETGMSESPEWSESEQALQDVARTLGVQADDSHAMADACIREIVSLRTTVAALTAENERLRENEHTLRMGWWLSHGCSGLYGDDGEMQCGQCMIDFKRDDPRDIETRIRNANMLKLSSQLVEAKEHG